MNLFLNDDFLLHGEVAKRLYHDVAETLPIVDYHCHIDAKEIAENRVFYNPTQLWLSGDHYKWRLMRANGIPEVYITGNSDDYVKFEKWAQTLEKAIGNPLYVWSHLELKRYFGYEGYLCGSNAKQVWDFCMAALGSGRSVRSLLEQSGVRLLCTTDDPISSLPWHKAIASDQSIDIKVLPTFRPDKILNIENLDFSVHIKDLSDSSGIFIQNFSQLKDALALRMDFFAQQGCLISDHALSSYSHALVTPGEIDDIFSAALAGKPLSKEEINQYRTAVLTFLASAYAARGWIMQLHLGVNRNVNSSMFGNLGADTGFDCIGGGISYPSITAFLDSLDAADCLPKMILYSIDPNDNPVIDSIVNCFNAPGIMGKIQHGAAWWFNDHKSGIKEYMSSLSSMGLLGACVGMLTDSRSFLSYVRHEYFRRLLCDYIGSLVDNGEYPQDQKTLEQLVTDISYQNSVNYFGFDL